MCVHIHVQIHVHILYMHACCTCMYAIHICVYVCTYVCIYIYTCVCVCVICLSAEILFEVVRDREIPQVPRHDESFPFSRSSPSFEEEIKKR